MATRIKSPVQRRSSLPLTQVNENDLETLRNSSSYQIALEKLSGTRIVDQEVSAAAMLHAIFEVGMSAIKETAELEGYAHIAEKQSSAEIEKDRKEARRRRPSWADEE